MKQALSLTNESKDQEAPFTELTLMKYKLILQGLSCLVFSARAQSSPIELQNLSDLEMRAHK